MIGSLSRPWASVLRTFSLRFPYFPEALPRVQNGGHIPISYYISINKDMDHTGTLTEALGRSGPFPQAWAPPRPRSAACAAEPSPGSGRRAAGASKLVWNMSVICRNTRPYISTYGHITCVYTYVYIYMYIHIHIYIYIPTYLPTYIHT